MLATTDSGNNIELFFDRSLERLRRISYHSLQSPGDVSRTSFFFEDEGMSSVGAWDSGTAEKSWAESRSSSGGVWPFAMRSVTSLATEK